MNVDGASPQHVSGHGPGAVARTPICDRDPIVVLGCTTRLHFALKAAGASFNFYNALIECDILRPPNPDGSPERMVESVKLAHAIGEAALSATGVKKNLIGAVLDSYSKAGVFSSLRDGLHFEPTTIARITALGNKEARVVAPLNTASASFRQSMLSVAMSASPNCSDTWLSHTERRLNAHVGMSGGVLLGYMDNFAANIGRIPDGLKGLEVNRIRSATPARIVATLIDSLSQEIVHKCQETTNSATRRGEQNPSIPFSNMAAPGELFASAALTLVTFAVGLASKTPPPNPN